MIEKYKIDPVLVGRRIDALRDALDMEKGAFAEVAGIDRSSYSKIIQGSKRLKIEMGYAIAKSWGVTLEYIYDGDLSGLSKLSDIQRKKIINSLTS